MRRPPFPPDAQCPLCLGTIHPGTTTFMADLKSGIMIVRDVPANICSQCGEEWLDMEVSDTLDGLAAEMKAKGAELQVFPYPAGKMAEVV